MTALRPVHDDPVHSLAVEVDAFRRLIELLRIEQEVLRTAGADALADITQSKLAQVHALQDLGTARTQALRAHGFNADAAGMYAELARAEDPLRAYELWEALVTLAADAQRQNALNARLASVQQRYIDRAMVALWNAAGCQSTYGADGRSQHHAAPRSLAAG